LRISNATTIVIRQHALLKTSSFNAKDAKSAKDAKKYQDDNLGDLGVLRVLSV